MLVGTVPEQIPSSLVPGFVHELDEELPWSFHQSHNSNGGSGLRYQCTCFPHLVHVSTLHNIYYRHYLILVS
jgi:hypothetical protein